MKQARVLTQTEIKRLLKVVSTTKHAGRNRLIVMLSYLAGLRACEIAALRVGDVITELNDSWEVKNEVLLKSSQTKGSKAQTVVFSTQLMKEISDYYKTIRLVVDRTDHLIGSQKKAGFSSQTIQGLFRELYEAAAISNASSHSGRRTFATSLSSRGASIRVLMKILGHRNISTTIGYVDASDDMLRRAVELV